VDHWQKSKRAHPLQTLIMPAISNATLLPGIPMNVAGAINTEQNPPIMEPKLDVSRSHPKPYHDCYHQLNQQRGTGLQVQQYRGQGHSKLKIRPPV
jgi:hypothetical protein